MTGKFHRLERRHDRLGPLYPFVGWEVLMVIVLLVVWVVLAHRADPHGEPDA